MLKLLFFSTLLMAQFAFAANYVSEEIELENGNHGKLALTLGDDGIYFAIIQELSPEAKLLCESEKQGYWEINGRLWLMWYFAHAEQMGEGFLITVHSYSPVLYRREFEITATNTEFRRNFNVPNCLEP